MLIIAAILAALLVTIPRTRRLAHIILLTAVANPHCSWSDGFRGYVTYLHRSTRVEELEPACRLKQTDAGGYQLWTTPIGDFWSPKDAPIAGMLTEVEQGVYAKVRPGDVALDCGANVGVVFLLVRDLARPPLTRGLPARPDRLARGRPWHPYPQA